MLSKRSARLLFLVVACITIKNLPAQNELREVIKLDSTFWLAYNSCNVDEMRRYFTDDLEFYHDKGGITKGLENFLTTVKQNLCSKPDFRLRR